MGIDVEDILFEVFGVQKDSYISFKDVIAGVDRRICSLDVQYRVEKSKQDHEKAIQETIIEEPSRAPVNVFCNTEVKIKMVKKFYVTNKLPCYTATKDFEMRQIQLSIRN